MKMSWALTWKKPEPGTGATERRGKARLGVLGFKDFDLLDLDRDSTTLNFRLSLTCFCTIAVRGWELHEGDIKNAFLQGDPTEVESGNICE